MKGNLKESKGTYFCEDGAKYEGEFAGGLREGIGKESIHNIELERDSNL